MTIRQEPLFLLSAFIRDKCGVHLTEEKAYLIESRLAHLLRETNSRDFSEFYFKVKAEPHGLLVEKIIDAITTKETLWFRDAKTWAFIRETVLPAFSRKLENEPDAKIRIWSAGCSTGQEPYSVAITLDRAFGQGLMKMLSPERIEIIGSDISESTLVLARSGRYNRISMGRGLDDEFRNRYFTQDDRVWTLAESIRRRVTFRRLNLLHNFDDIGTFDLILCRNVGIYFTEECRRDIFTRLADRLMPGGILLLGATESMKGLDGLYERLSEDNVLYYKRKGPR